MLTQAVASIPTSQPSSVDTAKAKAKAKPLTSEELGSTDYFLQEKGFTVGIRVIEKGIDGPCKVFEIKDIVEHVAHLMEIDVFRDESELTKLKVKVDKLATHWARYKGNLCKRMQGEWGEHVATKKLRGGEVEEANALFFLAQREFALSSSYPHEKHSEILSLQLVPNGIRANVKLKKHELYLIPLLSLSQISLASGQGGVETVNVVEHSGKTQKLCFGRAAQPSKNDNVADFGQTDVISPCWWVTSTQKKDEANMDWFSKKGNYGQTVYWMSNTRAVDKNELLRYKIAEVVKKTAFSSAEEVDAPPPSKKAKAIK